MSYVAGPVAVEVAIRSAISSGVIVNPLAGTREGRSRAKLESMWRLVDHRAIATGG